MTVVQALEEIRQNKAVVIIKIHSSRCNHCFALDYIPNLSIGDEITVENYWNTLTYKVIDKQIHKKDESADCYITEGRDLLTLITCVSNGRGGFDRFYLISERK
ncbi:sortase domain-bontaining protein [Ruminococcus sp. JE7B6]|uniref:sortase domain-containing protein n=1 Tax=Ruminococcus sp. JE7B6 TaxID=3233380 RepID=UPI003899AB9F